MCGIVGYIGSGRASELLLEGLRKLEYRGYDSAGMALLEGGKIVTYKAKGKIDNLSVELAAHAPLTGNAGIGHTRWATHGIPNELNAHPHTAGRVTIVHNGIIENYARLKAKLIYDGRIFSSETDTEVIAHLLDKYYASGKPIEAIAAASNLLTGSFALGIMFADIPDKLYAVRRDSPLIAAKSADGSFIASDIPAILSKTRDYYLMDAGEIAELTRGEISFYDYEGTPIKKPLLRADFDIEAAEKGGYPHFMLKEIAEQPDTVLRTVSPRLKGGHCEIFSDEISDTGFIKRIIITACGSAMHAGLLGRVAIERLARIPVEVKIASEFRYENPILSDGDLVIVISQSGETADSLAALRLAKSRGIPCYAIVNVLGSSIAREADKTLYTHAGPEISVATTKAYTAQVALLYALAVRLGVDRKTLDGIAAKRLTAALLAVPKSLKTLLSPENIEVCQRLAASNQSKHDIFFIGRGQDAALCAEGSLKLKEISYMHSEAYAAGELKHGTISLITDGVPCVALSTEDALIEKTLSNIKEVATRGAEVLFICKSSDARHAEKTWKTIELPRVEEVFMPLLAAVPLQLYAYYTALCRGCDVDKPRNLAKSVTVE